jgi:trehalose 6-phosphate synthase
MTETPESLRHLLRTKLGKQKFVVVSNREPYVHFHRKGRVEWMRPVSGLTMALDPLMQVSHGTWVAHGSGPADRQTSDENGYVCVPPGQGSYHLKRVWLTKEQVEKYYDGFSNAALWPLCHVVFQRPTFREDHWKCYQEVNEIFAEKVAEEIGDSRAFVFIQDYHFALLPKLLRERCPHAILAQFWHIPWPNPEVFRICPWRREILEGLLGSDIIGFHIRYHCQNFMETVDRELEARLDGELTAVVRRGHTTRIRAFPISVDFAGTSRRATSSETAEIAETLRRKLHLREKWIVGLGVDRLDYTKGIPERLVALDVFFSKYPEYQRRVVFVQVGVPSRTGLEEYKSLSDEVDRAVRKLNRRYGYREWQPVIYIRENLDSRTLIALYGIAHFLIVSSLHDGMNLVAKEYVASQADSNGVLLLSRFTGAARELRDALLINPYSPSEVAEAIREAVEMGPIEIRRRMGRMRERVRENDIYKWAASILKKLSKVA